MKEKPNRMDAQPEVTILSHPWYQRALVLGSHDTRFWSSQEAISNMPGPVLRSSMTQPPDPSSPLPH